MALIRTVEGLLLVIIAHAHYALDWDFFLGSLNPEVIQKLM